MIGTKGAFSSIAGGATRGTSAMQNSSRALFAGQIEDDKAAQAGVPVRAAQTYLHVLCPPRYPT